MYVLFSYFGKILSMKWTRTHTRGHSKTTLTSFWLFLTTYLPTTDFGHMKAKSLIFCGPNSNSNPKYLGCENKGLVFVEILMVEQWKYMEKRLTVYQNTPKASLGVRSPCSLLWHFLSWQNSTFWEYRGSPTYAVFTTAVFGLCTCNWGIFALVVDPLQSH